jgi:hypothetical protein
MKTNSDDKNQSPVRPISGSQEREDTIDALLADYFGPRSLWERIFRDEEEALQAATLLELRGEKSIPDAATAAASSTDTASYEPLSFEVNDEGPIKQDHESVENTQIDLGAIWDHVNLRFDHQIKVAYRDPSETANAWVTYDADDSPLPAIEVETQYLWLKRGPDADANPTVQIEAGAPAASMGEGTKTVDSKQYPYGGGFDYDGANYPYIVSVEADAVDADVLKTFTTSHAGDIVAHVTTTKGVEFDIPLAETTGTWDDWPLTEIKFKDPNNTTARLAGVWGGI